MKTATPDQAGVFVVEDSEEIRSRMVGLLREGGLQVVGEAVSSAGAIEGILRTRPMAVVLDLHLATGTGVDVLRATRSQTPNTAFIVLTAHPEPAYRKACMDLGASHFLDKSTEFSNVVPIIRNLAGKAGLNRFQP